MSEIAEETILAWFGAVVLGLPGHPVLIIDIEQLFCNISFPLEARTLLSISHALGVFSTHWLLNLRVFSVCIEVISRSNLTTDCVHYVRVLLVT
jgi:hypothetical protein